jgi:hypothetical protein
LTDNKPDKVFSPNSHIIDKIDPIDTNKAWLKLPPSGGFVVLQQFSRYKIYESGHVVRYRKTKKPKTLSLSFMTSGEAVLKMYDDKAKACRVVYLRQLVAQAFYEYDRYTQKIQYRKAVEDLPYHKDNFTVVPHHDLKWRGAGNCNNKLTEKDVLEIRKMRAEGKQIKEIMRVFPVVKSQISLICSGKRWGWL